MAAASRVAARRSVAVGRLGMSWYVLLAIILGVLALLGAVIAVAGGRWVLSRAGRNGRRH